MAFSSIASKTGARSPGERLITSKTSAVAVCCSSASRCLGHQPRILDRDHRLSGEALQQRDLGLGERLYLGPQRTDPTDISAILPQRYQQNGPHTQLNDMAEIAGNLRRHGSDVGVVDQAFAIDKPLTVGSGRSKWQTVFAK